MNKNAHTYISAYKCLCMRAIFAINCILDHGNELSRKYYSKIVSINSNFEEKIRNMNKNARLFKIKDISGVTIDYF